MTPFLIAKSRDWTAIQTAPCTRLHKSACNGSGDARKPNKHNPPQPGQLPRQKRNKMTPSRAATMSHRKKQTNRTRASVIRWHCNHKKTQATNPELIKNKPISLVHHPEMNPEARGACHSSRAALSRRSGTKFSKRTNPTTRSKRATSPVLETRPEPSNPSGCRHCLL